MYTESTALGTHWWSHSSVAPSVHTEILEVLSIITAAIIHAFGYVTVVQPADYSWKITFPSAA